MWKLLAATALAALVATTAPVSAQTTYTVTLNGLQEVPANASPGSGFGTLTLAGVNLDWNISFTGLTAGVTVAHIHGPAGIGTNGPVLLSLNPVGSTSGIINGTNTSVSSTVVNALNNGLAYVNIHTSTFPGGEIRGQIQVVPEPSTMALAGLGLLTLVVAMRRRGA